MPCARRTYQWHHNRVFQYGAVRLVRQPACIGLLLQLELTLLAPWRGASHQLPLYQVEKPSGFKVESTGRYFAGLELPLHNRIE